MSRASHRWMRPAAIPLKETGPLERRAVGTLPRRRPTAIGSRVPDPAGALQCGHHAE